MQGKDSVYWQRKQKIFIVLNVNHKNPETTTDNLTANQVFSPFVASQVLLTVESDTDEVSEGEEEPADVGPIPHVQYSGGPLRPSWVVV